MQAVLAATYVAALCALLWVARKNRGLYALAKGVCSGLFLVCALAAWFTGSQSSPAQFAVLLGGLALCALGDVLLGLANRRATHVDKKPFLAGTASFTLAHGLFCLLYFWRSPFRWYALVLPALLVWALFWLEKKERIRLKRMRAVGYVYTFIVGLMASAAAETAVSAGPFLYGGLATALGAGLFLLSDGVLLFLYFGTRRKSWYRPANLICYYLGMYLLAASAWWL